MRVNINPSLIIPLVVLALPIASILFVNNFYNQLPRDQIVEGIVGQPRNLHPLKVQNNPVDDSLVALLYRSLLKYSVEGELVTDLAESHSISEDGLLYTFNLRKNVNWHDGKKFTADDVIFTASRHPELKQVQVEKIDDYTVRFTLTQVYAPFLDLLTVPIAPEHMGLDSPGLKAVGTGDFAVTFIDPAPNFIQAIHLKRVNNFADGRINQLTLRFYNDREELQTALFLGEIDAYAGEAISYPGFSTKIASLKGSNYAVFINLRKEGLQTDIDFRKALARSTPRGIIANQVLNGRYNVIEGPIHDTWASEKEVEHYYFEADVDPQYEGEFTLAIPDTEDSRKVGEVLQEAWGRLGIEIKVKSYSAKDMEEKVLKTRDFDFVLLGREVGHDPDRYSYWHSTQGDYPGANISGYKQVRVDKALEKGRQSVEREERKTDYSLFQQLIAADVPAIFLYQPRYFFTIRDRVQEIDLRDVYTPKDRYKSINNWRISP